MIYDFYLPSLKASIASFQAWLFHNQIPDTGQQVCKPGIPMAHNEVLEYQA